MKRVVTAAIAIAASAVILAGTASTANAGWRGNGWGWGGGLAAGLVGGAIIGGAIANSRAYAPAPPGYAYYPAYAEPVPGPGCYWARVPVYDPAGNIVSWRGRPRLVCP